MPITLDGTSYKVFQTNYGHKQDKYGSEERGLTGQPLRVEGGAFQNEFDLTLVCAPSAITTLRASFAKVTPTGTPAANLLNFVDEEGMNFNPASGSDNSTHRYGTGVFFTTLGAPKPLTAKGWRADNLMTVQVTLIVKDSAL
jgi:hypothetical protein